MTVTCKCGGKYRRTDIVEVYVKQYEKTMWQDTDSKVAHWKCSGCGNTRTQRKRQGKTKES